MKAAIIQPSYSMEFGNIDRCFDELLSHLDKCDESVDLILLPEYSDVPAVTRDAEENNFYIEKHRKPLINKVCETAKRCKSLVFVNMADPCELGYRNTTFVYDKNGEVIAKYYKSHPAPSEVKSPEEGGYGLDVDYSYDYCEPYIFEYEGIRYAFLTCYDFYFYEAFPTIARQNVDIIIGNSLQRSDRHEALEIIGRFLCYNTNAYLLRSSVSLGADSPICGSSMAVSPHGEMLLDMKNDVGVRFVEFDPHDKYYKPAGFGGEKKAHYEYIEVGRRPQKYRPAGPAISRNEKTMPYPRICSHRGFNAVAPENSMPAFASAIALGAEEIEFDLWPTLDGEIVSIHDSTLDRVSTGSGKVYEKTLAELRTYDFGIKFSEKFRGLSIVTFEEILKKFACHTVMNIHIKPLSLTEPYPEDIMKKIVALIRKYDCEKFVYFMLEPDIHIKQFKEYAPDIPVCVGHLKARPWEIVDRAIRLGADKVQFFKPYFNREMVEKAHAHNILCNVFWSDDEDEANELLDMGMDTILTNDYNKILLSANKHLGR